MSSDWKPTLVVAAVITYRGKVLIHRRAADDTLSGRWEFPGGKVLYGEDLKAAVKREVIEELGKDMDVDVRRLLHCQVNDYNDGYTEYCVLYYHCAFCVPPDSLEYFRTSPVQLVEPKALNDYDMLPGSDIAVSLLSGVKE